MKSNIIKNINKFLVISLLIFNILSCTSKTENKLPIISNATYTPYNFNGERGYFVEFEIINSSDTPTAVVINKIKKPISIGDKTGSKFKINVISLTSKIVNYKVEGSAKPNGVFFSNLNGDQFMPVKFILK